MSLRCDLFWSMRSPYCYLAIDRTLELVRKYELGIELRPVYPLAIRSPEFFGTAPRHYRRYNLLDTKRVGQYLGLPFQRPVPDPVVQDLATSRIDSEQPYIFRLTRLAMAATVEGRGLAFVDKVSRLLWDGSVKGWNEGDHLDQAVRRAGLDLPSLDRAITASPDHFDSLIRANEKELDVAGHWGVPIFVFHGEPFFGQDRIDLLIWRLKQNGLRNRAAAS